MGTFSLNRLSDKTVAKYEHLEAEGKLTPRQKKALTSHRAMLRFSESADAGKSFHGALLDAIRGGVKRGRE